MPTPLNPEDYRDMDEPVNVDGNPEDVLRALLALSPQDDEIEAGND